MSEMAPDREALVAPGPPERPAPGGAATGDLVIDLLDALEGIVVNGRRVPFSAAVMVNEEEALDYIDRARAALPEDVKAARVVVERRQELVATAEDEATRVVSGAHAEAERLVGAARAEAERVAGVAQAEARHITQTATEHAAALISAHAVTVGAEQRAAEITARAAAEAAGYQERADGYARELLTRLAGHVDAALGELRRGIEMLPPPGATPAAPPRGTAVRARRER